MQRGYVLFDNRSGSTFLCAMLNRYDGIDVSLESQFTTRILDFDLPFTSTENIELLIEHLYSEVQFQELGLNREILTERCLALVAPSRETIIDIIVDLLFQNCSPQNFWLLKDAVYRYIELLSQMRPNTYFIHIFRDGRGVHQSKSRSRGISGELMSEGVIKSAIKWRQRFSEIENQSECGATIINVRYEDLIADPDTICEGILKSLGVTNITMTKKVEDYHSRIGIHQSELHTNVGREAIKSNSDTWRQRMSSHEVRLYQFMAGKQLKRHDYEILEFSFGVSEYISYMFFCLQQVWIYVCDIFYRVYLAVFVNKNSKERWRIFFSISKK
jgi:hypothetical protein